MACVPLKVIGSGHGMVTAFTRFTKLLKENVTNPAVLLDRGHAGGFRLAREGTGKQGRQLVRALEFKHAVNVQACVAGDLHAIASYLALHVPTSGAELSRTEHVLTQPSRPIWSQYAMYRAGCGVLIDACRG